MRNLEIQRCDSTNADFRNLIKSLDAELDERYGNLQKQYDVYNQIEFLETVVVAYEENTPVGCGCFKRADDQNVEMKRVFVWNNCRGKGIASLILKMPGSIFSPTTRTTGAVILSLILCCSSFFVKGALLLNGIVAMIYSSYF
jgi:hypothetical protein